MNFSTAATVLTTIAGELAKSAKANMPKLRTGEKIKREWYAEGVYYRETVLNGETCLAQYDFRRREASVRAA